MQVPRSFITDSVVEKISSWGVPGSGELSKQDPAPPATGLHSGGGDVQANSSLPNSMRRAGRGAAPEDGEEGGSLCFSSVRACAWAKLFGIVIVDSGLHRRFVSREVPCASRRFLGSGPEEPQNVSFASVSGTQQEFAFAFLKLRLKAWDSRVQEISITQSFVLSSMF